MSTLLLSPIFAGSPIRILGTPEKPLFVAADVCRILGLGNTSQAVNGNPDSGALGLEDDEKGVTNLDTLGGIQKVTVVNESGLYALIFKSRKPEAKVFRRWVTSEVLPALRRTGSYSVQAAPALPQTFSEALRALADTVEINETLALENTRLTDKNLALVESNVAMEPKAALFDVAMSSNDLIGIDEVAKLLGLGERRLFEFLRAAKILRNNPAKKWHNTPYQEYIDRGYFKVLEFPFNTREHGPEISLTTKVYQRGVEYIRGALLRREGLK